jgi:hypothetical protein
VPQTPASVADREPLVYRLLEEFYQSVVMPPPLGLYNDPEGFARYWEGVHRRIVAIMGAYDGELRALHLDLLERYGTSPFVGDDAALSQGNPQLGAPMSSTSRSALSPMANTPSGRFLSSSPGARSPSDMTLEDVARRPSDFERMVLSNSSFGRPPAPAYNSAARGAKEAVKPVGQDTEDLYACVQPHTNGVTYVTMSGRARHPQQVRAVQDIFDSLKQPEPLETAVMAPEMVKEEASNRY